ncbi:7896_t:CDS:1, partial [Scutellospora calospora]
DNNTSEGTYRDNQSSSKTNEQKVEDMQANSEDPLLKNKGKNKEIFFTENNKENNTREIEKNLENKQKHVNTTHDLSNTT